MTELPPGFTLVEDQQSGELPKGFTALDPDIPVPSTPEELQAHERERAGRSMLDRVSENIRQNTMMGGATDWQNILSAIPASTSVAGVTGAGQGALSTAARHLVGQGTPNAMAATRSTGQAAGYVVPASQSGRPSIVGRIVEGLAGKQNVQQAASMRNQAVTDRLAAKALGLPENTQLTPTVLSNVRKEAGKAYEAVKRSGTITGDPQYLQDLVSIRDKFLGAAMDFPGAAKTTIFKDLRGVAQESFGADAAVSMIRQLRDKASTAFRAGDASDGHAYKEMAAALESQIERHLTTSGSSNQIVKNYRKARELIAKSHDIEDALNSGTAEVSARKLSRSNAPPSGELGVARQFSEAFPKATQDPALYGAQPLFNLADMAAGAVGGATFGPGGMALGAVRPVARNVMGALTLKGQPMPGALHLQSLIAAIRAARGGEGVAEGYVNDYIGGQQP